MKFTKISIRNFLTLGEAEARLDDRGLVLIQGDNRDDTSQNSNGAGKSSLADAVSWALFGVTARGESGNDVINTKVKRGGATVTLEINDDGTYYKIERTRLKGKGTLEVHRKDKGKWVALTKGTMKLTQDMLDRLIGCSADVFCNAIYAGQEKTPDLPGMTDKMLKVLIEEAAGINKLERAYKVARDRMNNVAKDIDNKRVALDGAHRMVLSRQNTIDRLVVAQSEWEATHKEDIQLSAKNIKALKEAAEKAQAHFESLDKGRAKIESELTEINERLGSIAKFNRALTDANKVVSQVETRQKLKEREIEQTSRAIRSEKAEYEAVDKIAGQPCDSCGKPYTKDDIEPRKARIKSSLESGVADLKRLRDEQKAIDAELSDALSAQKKAQRAIPDTSKEIKRRDELADSLIAIKNAQRDAHSAATRVRDEMVRLKKLKAEVNPNDKLLAHERKVLAEFKKERQEIEDQVVALETDLEVKREAARVFGPAGVRAHILDTVTPFLNDRTNHYLSHLTDGNISAVWSTIDTTAKGEIREKFAIAVQSKVGALTFRGLSGGEKRKVRLACAMALQDLVSSRATKPIELFIADEIDHALDDSGLERLMGILEDKASDRGTVLVISHNSLSDWIRNQVTVVKEGGQSRLEGSALA